jgi:nucleotide-binding universal stress UspA family protein
MGSSVSLLAIIPTTVNEGLRLSGVTGYMCIIDVEGGYRDILDESIVWLKERGVAASPYLAHGEAIETIVAHARRLGSDLIVVGQYPAPGATRWWSGDKRASLAERASCSVFISVSA